MKFHTAILGAFGGGDYGREGRICDHTFYINADKDKMILTSMLLVGRERWNKQRTKTSMH